ncbi:MAG: class I SAM-dependent methyltransferase [Proteobacteria bacterium]|nr:class I SAM-dependent methyltransferase [Pseudomonadota bacterium]
MRDEAWHGRMTGNAFDDEDVVRCYVCRPPYAPDLFTCLAEMVPEPRCLVDLGCGPGKVTLGLADKFTEVLAIDPSGPMIAEARRHNRQPNIRWTVGRAEDVDLPEHIDLVTAGAAIHWMSHEQLFPRLAGRAALFGAINSKRGSDPAWVEDQRAFMRDWLSRIDQIYDETAFAAKGRQYERWIDLDGRAEFPMWFRQSIDDYVTAMHATATFSRNRMGTELSGEFDKEFTAALEPFASDGMLAFEVVSELTWGVPRATPTA